MPRRMACVAGPPSVALGHSDRLRLGLHHWPDGTMGFHRSEEGLRVVGPNGPHLGLVDVGGPGWGEVVARPEVTLADPVVATDHASGGPIHVDEATGLVLVVYHGEHFRAGDPQRYHSFLGMAVSFDGARTFEDLGPIVTHGHDLDDVHAPVPVEIGSGAFVVHDGWFHLYFGDRGIGGARLRLGVARAPVREVVERAIRLERADWRKLADGRFEEPGLGGRADELLPGVRFPVLWFDVAHVPAVERFVLVFSTVLGVREGRAQWNHGVLWSTDGVLWEDLGVLYDEDSSDEMLYVTIDSGGRHQRVVEGDTFDLYRLVSCSSTDRWADARLERVPVSIREVRS